jgi:hypothetical protein
VAATASGRGDHRLVDRMQRGGMWGHAARLIRDFAALHPGYLLRCAAALRATGPAVRSSGAPNGRTERKPIWETIRRSRRVHGPTICTPTSHRSVRRRASARRFGPRLLNRRNQARVTRATRRWSRARTDGPSRGGSSRECGENGRLSRSDAACLCRTFPPHRGGVGFALAKICDCAVGEKCRAGAPSDTRLASSQPLTWTSLRFGLL